MGRERFRYQAYFFGLLVFVLPLAAFKTKDPAKLFPFLPMSFLCAFQYDSLYGNMHMRIQHEAARLIREEPERFYMPRGNGLVTHAEYKEHAKVPADYKERINLDSRYGHLKQPTNPLSTVFTIDGQDLSK